MLLMPCPRTFPLLSTRLSLSVASRSREVRLGGSVPTDRRTTSPATSRRQIQFALFPVRSPLLREYLLVFFPAGTKMFQFTAFPIQTDQVTETTYEVALGNLGLQGCMRLTQAYRSLPRPSSAS